VLLASSLDNLAAVQAVQGKYDKAEENYRNALAIRELYHAGSIEKIGKLLDVEARLKDAETLYRTNLPLLERVNDTSVLEHYAAVLRKLNKAAAAAAIEAKVKK